MRSLTVSRATTWDAGAEASCRTPGGEMVFGSTDGFWCLTRTDFAEPFVPPVVLTDFLPFNTPVIETFAAQINLSLRSAP